MLDSIIFYFFASVAVLSAALMITRRNTIHSAVFLITTLLATAGIFLQLRAEFLFVAQIILYVSGIMVLFVFVIMLVRLDVVLSQIKFSGQKWVSLIVALVLFVQVTVMLWASRKLPGAGLPDATTADRLPPNSEALAQNLFGAYLLPFEIASVLLLVAMVGAVVMAKKRTEPE
jgi:NADH-quinone oxidoreductase subunit J